MSSQQFNLFERDPEPWVSDDQSVQLVAGIILPTGPTQEFDYLVPDALCGQDFKCIGKKCHFYFCMERLSVEEAIGHVFQHLNAKAIT